VLQTLFTVGIYLRATLRKGEKEDDFFLSVVHKKRELISGRNVREKEEKEAERERDMEKERERYVRSLATLSTTAMDT